LKIERYSVYSVDLDPVVGSGMYKTRSAVVVSDDLMNTHLNTVIVCPITGRLHPRWPSRIQTVLNDRPAEIAVDQIRTIDKRRLRTPIGALEPPVGESIRHLVTLMYGVLSVRSEDE
jgi:mRNA interferase MazF